MDDESGCGCGIFDRGGIRVRTFICPGMWEKVTARAEAYVRKAIQAGMNKPLTDEKIESFIENEIGELLDCIDDVNHVYFKNGMKLGASLILQLLGAWEDSVAVRK